METRAQIRVSNCQSAKPGAKNRFQILKIHQQTSQTCTQEVQLKEFRIQNAVIDLYLLHGNNGSCCRFQTVTHGKTLLG